MAEYYPLLARAVSALPNASREAREGIYERARKALLSQLRSHQPPLPEEDIERESQALEEAIARLESEPPSSPPGPSTPAASAGASEARSSVAPRLGSAGRPLSLSERAQAHRAAKASVARPSASIAPSAETRLAAEAAQFGDGEGPVSVSATDAAPDAQAPLLFGDLKADPLAIDRPIPRSGVLWKFGRSREDSESLDQIPLQQGQTELHSSAPTGEGSDEAEAEIASPKVEASRPLAPGRRSAKGRAGLYWGLGAFAVLALAGIGALAFLLREAPQTIGAGKSHVAALPKPPSKIVDRINLGAAGLSKEPPPIPAQGSSPMAASSQSPGAPQPTPPRQNSTSGAQGSGQTQPPVPIAQRAALLVQSPTASDPQAIATYVGSVIWRLETVNPGAGRSPILAVRAEIEVPDAHLKASMLLEKNTDENLPASHTIELRFTPGPGSVIGDVKQVDTPQMRKEESPAGDPLEGIPTPITTNYFLVGLAKGEPAQSHNIDLMKGAGWFDIPMLLANGKIAKITFEKGVPGQQDLNDALASWAH